MDVFNILMMELIQELLNVFWSCNLSEIFNFQTKCPPAGTFPQFTIPTIVTREAWVPPELGQARGKDSSTVEVDRPKYGLNCPVIMIWKTKAELMFAGLCHNNSQAKKVSSSVPAKRSSRLALLLSYRPGVRSVLHVLTVDIFLSLSS